MKFKKFLAGACASAMVFSTFVVPTFAEDTVSYTRSVTLSAESAWDWQQFASDQVADLFGDVDPSDATSIVIKSDNTAFKYGYNGADGWVEEEGKTSYTIDPSSVNVTAGEFYFMVGYCQEVAWSSTITWEVYTEKEEETTTEAEPTEAELTNAGQTRAENDVYRLNLYNSWTKDENDMIIDPSITADASKLIVTFKVEGLGSKSGKIGINFSDESWGDHQYWFDGNEYASIKAEVVNVTEDGTYTISVETVDGSALGKLAFADIQTDIASDAGEKDLEITSGFKLSVVSVETVAVTKEEETAPENETTAEETTAAETTTANPSDNDGDDKGDVAPVAGLAFAVVAALGVAVVASKKNEIA